MNSLVLIKQTPDTEANITVSGGKINDAGIKWIISPYDEIALEEAIRWKEKSGGTVTAISLGPDKVVEALRTAYAMGADKAIHVKLDNYEMLDSFGIAGAIADAIKGESFDVIFAGRQSNDSDNGQVPYILGTRLGYPVIGFAKEVTLEAAKAVVKSEAEGGEATYEAAFPVIITVNASLNEPRYPSLKGIMASKKKPIDKKDANVGQAKVQIIGFEPPPDRPPGRIIEAEEPEMKAKLLVKAMHEDIKVV